MIISCVGMFVTNVMMINILLTSEASMNITVNVKKLVSTLETS